MGTRITTWGDPGVCTQVSLQFSFQMSSRHDSLPRCMLRELQEQ